MTDEQATALAGKVEYDRKIVRRILSRSVANPKTGCIEYCGSRYEKGYGCAFYKGKNYHAHRVMWMASVGRLLDTEFVMHTCDNPPCVNIEHLCIGTNKDNMVDCARKKRNGMTLHPERSYFSTNKKDIHRKCGEDAHRAILTEKQARKILQERREGCRRIDLMKKYNVSGGCIDGICSGRKWRHLTNGLGYRLLEPGVKP